MVLGDVAGIKPELLNKLHLISAKVGKNVYISSGKRSGDVSASAHNSGIAADIKIDGMNTVAICDELVSIGCTGVGEYYNNQGVQETFAHGDIRGLVGSESSGDYAPDGTKSSKLCWWREGSDNDAKYIYGSRKSGHSCS